MRGPELAHLQVFVEVARQGNFGRAAKALKLSPSTLSETIKHLEERLGVRLFNRTTRSVALTDAGQRLLLRLGPAFASVDSAVDEIIGLKGKPAGKIRVHSSRVAADTHLHEHLGGFYEAYPDIELDITVDSTLGDIVKAGYDLTLRLREYVDDDMTMVKLGPDLRQVPFCSPRYIERWGRPETLLDLKKHRCINWRKEGHGIYRWEFFVDGQWTSMAVEGPLTVSDREIALRAALQDVGIGFWIEEPLAAHIAAGRLVVLLDEFCAPFPGVVAAYPKQRVTPAAVKAFVDYLRRAARHSSA